MIGLTDKFLHEVIPIIFNLASDANSGSWDQERDSFNSPHGFCLGMEEDIVVADTNNHRIQIFEKTGEFKYQFGIPGQFLVQSNPSGDP